MSARVGTISATVALNLGVSIGATPLGAIEAPAVEHLLELLDRPPWQREELCREYAGRVDFFPGRGESLEPAKALCAACLVRPECLLYALEHDEPYGVWGGLSAQERRTVTGSNTGASTSRLLEGHGPTMARTFVQSNSHRSGAAT